MRFEVKYWRTLVNEAGDYEHKQRSYVIDAINEDEAIAQDKENWNFYREPCDVKELACDTHLAAVQTFLDREMPFLKPYRFPE